MAPKNQQPKLAGTILPAYPFGGRLLTTIINSIIERLKNVKRSSKSGFNPQELIRKHLKKQLRNYSLCRLLLGTPRCHNHKLHRRRCLLSFHAASTLNFSALSAQERVKSLPNDSTCALLCLAEACERFHGALLPVLCHGALVREVFF